ncbi:MAG: cupin domain-containing protein [Ignavibacteriota bacterium]|jgi:quercetin dioxygenase-like cupin family protein|nr:MAG: cupin domain-containing protein [Chlorobiota bacterium]MBE7476031.1 cupin domain-containing protein [Ignavibacteriales bacterium]MBL1123164.1 cupin domain-containing protein [Ignavibacteriota bacterium]MCE7857147.1 cupin domain-containing protein [Ignavibacteria bacterium CHB3]MCZ7614956.1 cupin domain-containing protein [Ignavibacteriaceae bacterium]
MKIGSMKIILITAIALIAILNFNCNKTEIKNMPDDKSENQNAIFAQGDLVPSEYFTGNAWNKSLVADDSIFTTSVGSVTFEVGARSNWHSHPAGQILLVTDGVGYHQIKGEPIEIIRKGDVVKCPPDVIHWHGASRDSSMTHIYIVPNTEKGIVKWMEAVTDEEYRNL